MRALSGKTLKTTLDPLQSQAVTSEEDKHLLVLAGAGSGKTRVIIERIKYLLNKDIKPSDIAVMTFTKKAALEMQERIGGVALKSKHDSLFAGTFHSFALEMINSYKYFEKDADKRIIDRDDQIWLAQICLKELNLPSYLANNIISYISYAKNIMLPIEKYIRKFYPKKDDYKMALKACKLYETKKVSSKYLDYDDLMVHFLDVIDNNKTARDKICSRYKYLLVDEMQDTNPLQWQILMNYAKYIKLFCVGDDAQSIYAFRGADFKNIHSFTKRLQPSEVIKLVNNYRSTKEILDLSNTLLKRSVLKYDKKLIAIRGEGKKPKIYDFDDSNEEAEFVVRYIKSKKEANPSDFMVLVRSAFNAKSLEKELILQKIPYVFIGGQNLMQSEHIKDILSILQIICGYSDELVIHRFIRICNFYLKNKPNIEPKKIKHRNTNTILKILKEHFGETYFLYNGIIKISKLKEHPEKAIHQSIKLVQKYLMHTHQGKLKSIKDDLNFLEQISSNYKNLKAFLQSYVLQPFYKNEDNENKYIKIITIHSAKGTEAKYSILLQANNDVYPHKRAKGNIEKVEEERRILYVAMTRAKDELIITRTKTASRGKSDDGCEEYFLG